MALYVSENNKDPIIYRVREFSPFKKGNYKGFVLDCIIDSSGLHIGKRTYVGECVEDILSIGQSLFDTKVYHYPSGKKVIVKANRRVFRVPVPDSLHKIKRHTYVNLDGTKDSSEYRRFRTDNLFRAKSRLKQIALCNSWDYFVTFTFDDKKVNALNPDVVLKKTQNWLRNQVSRNNIKYLLVPELHKSGRIHFHALISGNINLVDSDTFIVEGFDKPLKSSTIVKRKISAEYIKQKVYNVSRWSYGFSTAIRTYGQPDKMLNYITKYMTKEVQKIFGHCYWFSRNVVAFPVVELKNEYDYYSIHAREYSHGLSDARFKYINHLGDVIADD